MKCAQFLYIIFAIVLFEFHGRYQNLCARIFKNLNSVMFFKVSLILSYDIVFSVHMIEIVAHVRPCEAVF